MLNRLVIFQGSALCFLVQPLVGRTLTPHFGGSATTWLTCLATFQLLLLAGYGYARWNVAHRRFRLHGVGLAVAAGAVGFVTPQLGGVAASFAHLTPCVPLNVIGAVLLMVGPAFLLLSANATLVQTLAGGNYRLYALSNVGSFVGLFLYPFVLEPFVALPLQWAFFTVGMFIYAALFARCARGAIQCAIRGAAGVRALPGGGGVRGATGVRALPGGAIRGAAGVRALPGMAAAWLLPLVSTFLLNALTAHLTVDIAPLPLVWAVLLGGYLLTWAIGFTRWGERLKWAWTALAVVAVFACVVLHQPDKTSGAQLAREFAAGFALLVFGGTALHAHLCAARPGAGDLARFNFLVALGGAAGGVLSGVAAPLVFDSLLEYPLALVALVAVFALLARRALPARLAEEKANFVLGAVVVLCACGVWRMVAADRAGDLARGRSFYGPWRVFRQVQPDGRGGPGYPLTIFKHGGTAHGFEPAEERDRMGPTGYYVPENGGLAFALYGGYAAERPVRVGLVGLGVGTMAWYAREGDYFRFYEICPQVAKVAQNGAWFDYLEKAKGKVEVKLGDARQSLSEERARGEEKWDVLVIDAYSGDAVPIHLITREAFELYLARLRPDGVLALHISNWHVDLVPVAKAVGRAFGLDCRLVHARGGFFSMEATWAFLSRRPLRLPAGTPVIDPKDVREVELPTDAKGSLLEFLKFGGKGKR